MIKIHIDFFFHKETREKKYIAFIIFLAYIFPRCVCVYTLVGVSNIVSGIIYVYRTDRETLRLARAFFSSCVVHLSQND